MKPVIYKTKPRLNNKHTIIDAYTPALQELFFLDYPNLKKGTPNVAAKLKAYLNKAKTKDLWIHYPAESKLVRTVDEAAYFKLRTARNKNLITEKEQKNFRNLSVGVAGLSVGSCIVSALVTSGGPKNIKIADFDILEVSNLNRIRAKLTDVGSNKTVIAASEVWSLDPFANLKLYGNGLNANNLEEFMLGKPKLSVFIDEMDSLPLKIQARMIAKKNLVPVLMATDNGDSVVLDVERFDLEPKREIFHGLIGKVDPESIKNLNYKQWLRLATKIVDAKYLTESMQDSLLQIGKTLPAVPQLGAIANVAGAAMCLALRRIGNKQSMPSGRYLISLEEKLFPNFNNVKEKKKRLEKTKAFKKAFI